MADYAPIRHQHAFYVPWLTPWILESGPSKSSRQNRFFFRYHLYSYHTAPHQWSRLTWLNPRRSSAPITSKAQVSEKRHRSVGHFPISGGRETIWIKAAINLSSNSRISKPPRQGWAPPWFSIRSSVDYDEWDEPRFPVEVAENRSSLFQFFLEGCVIRISVWTQHKLHIVKTERKSWILSTKLQQSHNACRSHQFRQFIKLAGFRRLRWRPISRCL